MGEIIKQGWLYLFGIYLKNNNIKKNRKIYFKSFPIPEMTITHSRSKTSSIHLNITNALLSNYTGNFPKHSDANRVVHPRLGSFSSFLHSEICNNSHKTYWMKKEKRKKKTDKRRDLSFYNGSWMCNCKNVNRIIPWIHLRQK